MLDLNRPKTRPVVRPLLGECRGVRVSGCDGRRRWTERISCNGALVGVGGAGHAPLLNLDRWVMGIRFVLLLGGLGVVGG